MKEDDYEIPDEIVTDIVQGDLFTISNPKVTHTMVCGSSTEAGSLKAILGKEKATMVFTDPPYLMNFQGAMAGNGKKNDRHEGILNDNLGKEDGNKFLTDFLALLKAHCQGGWYISFYRLGIDRMFQALEKTGMKWRNLIIWKKNHKNLSNSDYQSIYEPIFYGFADDYVPIVYGWEKDHDFRGQKGVHNDVIDDISLPSVWEIDRTKVNDLHPTMKPVELVARCVMNSSRKGETVLDMFLGSGTTMIACHQLGRNCTGIELDPKYCQVVIDRMLAFDPNITIIRNGKPYENKTA